MDFHYSNGSIIEIYPGKKFPFYSALHRMSYFSFWAQKADFLLPIRAEGQVRMCSQRSVLYTNAGSIRNKLNELQAQIQLGGCDMLTITETWLQDGQHWELNTPDYKVQRKVSLVDFCGQTMRADGIIINSHQESQKNYFVTVGIDCGFTMQAASPKDKVQFQFRFFLVYSLLRESSFLQPTTADTCNAGSYVQFYDGKDRNSPPIGSLLCGKSIPKPISSTGNYLSLRLVTRGQQPRVDFVGDFTSLRPGCGEEPYFQCQNGKCIPKSLVCDSESIDNCGDGSDESGLLPVKCKDNFSNSATIDEASPSTMEPNNSLSPSVNLTTLCHTPNRHHYLLPNSVPYPDSVTDDNSYVSLLALYIILGVVAGVVLLFWCCWSPGWLVWRLSVCRFLPCCNSFCAACQFCTHSCCRTDNSRLGKVTPQSTVPVAV
ncbi:uncharacterized protein ldlrad2 [Heterodontus francisci]|uniref:uncharacterized protein ldlrad2 n=1 Tax=Heterodontus francisci TaxID=7792 RepID=UPI00355BE2F1